MASKKISELVACTAPASSDLVVLVANSGSNTEKCTVENLLANSTANVAGNNVTGSYIYATDNTTPANSTATVTQGRIWYDDTYLYIAVGNNTIKRVTLEVF